MKKKRANKTDAETERSRDPVVQFTVTPEQRADLLTAMQSDGFDSFTPQWVKAKVLALARDKSEREQIAKLSEQLTELSHQVYQLQVMLTAMRSRIYSPNEIREIAASSMDPVQD